MRGPQPTIAHHRLVQAVVQGIKPPVGAARVAEMLDPIGKRGGWNSDADVSGNGRCRRAGIGNPTQHQRAERCIVHTDEITLGRGYVEVVDATRRVRTRTCPGREVRECGRDDRTRAKDRGFLHDISVRADKRARAAEHVAADVKRIDVDAQRRIVEEIATCAADKIEEGPDGAGADRAIAGRIADCNHHAVCKRGRTSRIGAGDIDDQQDPAPGHAVVADLRIAGESEDNRRTDRRRHRSEKHVGINIEHAIGDAGLGVAAQLPVDEGDELGGADCAHAVGRKRSGVGQGRTIEGKTGRMDGRAGQGLDTRICGRILRNLRSVGILRKTAAIRPFEFPIRAWSTRRSGGLARHDLGAGFLSGCRGRQALPRCFGSVGHERKNHEYQQKCSDRSDTATMTDHVPTPVDCDVRNTRIDAPRDSRDRRACSPWSQWSFDDEIWRESTPTDWFFIA